MTYQVPFVVPSYLTAGIKDRIDPPTPKKRRGRPPVPKYTKQEMRRRILKRKLKDRHGHHLDRYIARLEERLEILKEIRDEFIQG